MGFPRSDRRHDYRRLNPTENALSLHQSAPVPDRFRSRLRILQSTVFNHLECLPKCKNVKNQSKPLDKTKDLLFSYFP